MERELKSIGLARGDDPDSLVSFPIAVARDEGPQPRAEPQENETVLVIGVIGVMDEPSAVVIEHRLRFFEGNAVFALIFPVLALNPIRIEDPPPYSVIIS